MKIDDSGLFAVLVPTYEGTPYLKRTLDYFRLIAFDGLVVLSDNSSGAHRDFVAACPRLYPELQLEVHPFPVDIRFLDKVVASLTRIGSRFVMLHAHDDFMVPAGVERCVTFLAENASYAVARGRVARVSLGLAAPGGELMISLMPHPMRAYEQDDPLERVIDHIGRYNSTFYSVHRREDLVESFRVTEAATKNVIFFQYLSSCISALAGKVACLDELFYVRQAHVDSWSASLSNTRDYEHWPMLITAPRFSEYYQEFRAALSRLIEEACGAPAAELATRIDVAALGLFRRSFCAKEPDNPDEVRFFKRLQEAGSDEHNLLSSIVKFAALYPDTLSAAEK